MICLAAVVQLNGNADALFTTFALSRNASELRDGIPRGRRFFMSTATPPLPEKPAADSGDSAALFQRI